MELEEKITQAITEHKQKIELIQWAAMSSVASLVYSEYIRCIKNKYTPVFKVHLPAIKTVSDILSTNGSFMSSLSKNFVQQVIDHPLIRKYSIAPELVLLSENNCETMNVIFNKYMIPNISRRIPETISKKFDIDNPESTVMVEDSYIEMFKGIDISDQLILDFVVEEFVLQLLCTMPTMKKSLEFPESNAEIYTDNDQIVSIGNENAICPIQLNSNVIQNEYINRLLTFATATEITSCNDPSVYKVRNDEKKIINYKISTSPFNQICLMTLDGIEVPEDE
jgi:hypothetical protein